jgi:hypothetical protein
MSYSLGAIIGPRSTLLSETSYSQMKVIPLPQDFAMIPFTEELYEEIHGEPEIEYDPEEDEGFGKPTEQINQWMQRISVNSKVAYIEIDCWGGDCVHASTVWENKKIILGPLKTISVGNSGPPLSETGANKALRALGVQVTDLDEFWSLGLQKNRHTEHWIE